MRETLPVGGHHFYAAVVARFLAPLYAEVARGRPGARRVLDIGCGPGHLVRRIQQELPAADVLGIDIDHAQVKIARARGGRFEVGASHAIPLPAEDRDWILATETFHHWRLPDAGLAEMQRVLAPGGEAWIVELDAGMRRDELRRFTPLPVLGIVRAIARQHGYDEAGMQAVQARAEAAGFTATLQRAAGWWCLRLR